MSTMSKVVIGACTGLLLGTGFWFFIVPLIARLFL